MHHFTSKPQEYYESAVSEFPIVPRALFRIVAFFLYWFSRIFWRVRVEGLDELDVRRSEEGAIYICNHTSMSEIVMLYGFLRRRGRIARPVFKAELNRVPFLRWACSRAGGIPVERGTADMKSVRCAQHALQRGEDILIFPEGTRVRRADQESKIHGGFALMASMAKVPIVPVAVCGFTGVMPDGTHLVRPVHCWARAGEPVSMDDAPAGLKRSERMSWMEREAARRMYALRDALRAEHPGRL